MNEPTEPPILRGEAAALNRAKRMLSGKYTPADIALLDWCLTEEDKRGGRMPGTDPWTSVRYYYGEQIWPPQ